MPGLPPTTNRCTMSTKDLPVRRPGRPRDPGIHGAILEATRRLLVEEGYHRLTFEGVATAAGTTRSTVYRWWPTRGALVLEAAADHITLDEVPDTGDSHADIRAAIGQLIEAFTDPLARVVILSAIANVDGDLEMATQFRKTAVYPWRTSAERALRRAVERGDLSERADVQMLLDVIVGTVFQRTITMATPMREGLEDALVAIVTAS